MLLEPKRFRGTARGRPYIGIGEIVRFFEAFVSEPEDVEA
jgi:hypothetical protein